MASLNFKHLRYFWMVAKTGSIARAATQLHLTPQSISGQLSEFSSTLGVELFRRTGRNLELTDAGRRILSYAEDIFTTGDELLAALRDHSAKKIVPFHVGIADNVSKSVAYRLVEPALALTDPIRLICREGRLSALLADLAIHRLDLIIADRVMPTNLNVRGYSHLLGESGLTVFGTHKLAGSLSGDFPALLDNAPFLLPGEDVAVRPKLIQWFEANNPFDRAKEGKLVQVSIKGLPLPVSQDSWRVEWTETVRGHTGAVLVEPQTFEATLTVQLQPAATDAQVIKNPGGIAITGLSFSRVLEGASDK